MAESQTRPEKSQRRASRIGIVIPTRRMADLLPDAIESILSQEIHGVDVRTAPASLVDVIVVVDDLDPETRSVLDRYSPRVRWIEGDKTGQAGAVNKGLQMLDAEIVKFLNADDALTPGALEAVLDYFDTYEEAEFVYGDIEFMDRGGAVAAHHKEPSFSRFILLFGHNPFADPTCFWRRRVHDRVGYFSTATKYSLDFDFWVRCMGKSVVFAQLPRVLARFRVTGDNLSVANHQKMRREHYDIVVAAIPQLTSIPVSARYRLLDAMLVVARAYKNAKTLAERRTFSIGRFGALARTVTSR